MQQEIKVISWDLLSFVVRRVAYALYAFAIAVLVLMVLLSFKGVMPLTFGAMYANYAIGIVMLFAGYRLAIFHRDFFGDVMARFDV